MISQNNASKELANKSLTHFFEQSIPVKIA